MVAARGRGSGSSCSKGALSVWEDGKVLDEEGGDGRTTMGMDLTPMN